MDQDETIIIDIANDNVADNIILPFALESSALRGRIVRMGPVLNEILVPHDYPEAVSKLLAEALTATVLFSAMIKYNGIFTLQIQGDGPVPLLVVDMNSAGEVRGYARVSGDIPKNPSVTDLVGTGYIAFTVDQGNAEDRYQGIVPLEGDSLAVMCQNYFEQSEQIKTSFSLSAEKGENGWRSGGVMLQKIPDEGGIKLAGEVEEEWERSSVLLQSVKDEELTDADLTAEDLLFRLFHEEGVRIFETHNVTKGCRCSNEKLEKVLASLSADDRAECAKDGKITMTCEFCAKDWVFPVS